MKNILIIATLLLGTMVHADASPRHAVAKHGADSGVTVYNHDSPNPNIGWHTENGIRVCHYDCDNPEIPGSGARCRNVDYTGMPMRECVTGSGP